MNFSLDLLISRGPDLSNVGVNFLAPAANSILAALTPPIEGLWLLRWRMDGIVLATGAADPNLAFLESQMTTDGNNAVSQVVVPTALDNFPLIFSRVAHADIVGGSRWFVQILLAAAAGTKYSATLEAWYVGR